MQIERDWLLSTLRASGAERTAHHAEQVLPATIDLERDRQLLKRCGIEPNMLATMIEGAERAPEPG